jgi:hypothetical protein
VNEGERRLGLARDRCQRAGASRAGRQAALAHCLLPTPRCPYQPQPGLKLLAMPAANPLAPSTRCPPLEAVARVQRVADLALPVVVGGDEAGAAGTLVRDAPVALADLVDLGGGWTDKEAFGTLALRQHQHVCDAIRRQTNPLSTHRMPGNTDRQLTLQPRMSHQYCDGVAPKRSAR